MTAAVNLSALFRLLRCWAVAVIAVVVLGSSQPLALDQQRAAMLFQGHDWQALARLAHASARTDPKDGMAWYYLGIAENGLGRKAGAASAFEKALPNIPIYLHCRCRSLPAAVCRRPRDPRPRSSPPSSRKIPVERQTWA